MSGALAADQVWTPDDLDAVIGDGEDWRRYEIVDGVLVVSPSSTRLHERLVLRMGAALLAGAPDHLDVIAATMIDLHPSYRIPDVTVIRYAAHADERPLTQPGDVVLAVEIESPSSVTTDRITKPAQYAAAGIAHYWRVEVDPLRLNVYRLDGDVYVLSGSWAADETAVVSDPFDVTIELAGLMP